MPTPAPNDTEPDANAKESAKKSPRAKARAKGAKSNGPTGKGSAGANSNPVVKDETYGSLHEEDRVVMRHQIALNLDNFRAAPETFVAHPQRTHPPLRPVAAPFFSVIIPNYNGVRFLGPLLDALRQQTFRDFEVILADDSSSDESVAFVEQRYPEVRLLVNRRNEGFARTCNLAVDAAHGRLVVLLNNDTEPEPSWLAELAKTVCTNPHAAAIASKLLLFDEREKLHTTGDLMGYDGIPQNRGVWEVDDGQYDDDPLIFSASGGASAFRKDVWQQLGGFDEDFWMYLEDVDFGFRAQLAGWGAVFAPTARVYHHLSATGGGALASYYVGRNTIWTLAKNMPTSLLLRNLPAILLAQLEILIDGLANIRGTAARARLRGQLDGLLGLPHQLRKRQLIQARRCVDDINLDERLT
ncbi:MAG: glycosyltransferase family 2 protein [Caldilineaceae bacterium]|nr:glycosyltransferase family 2 protein [Caldilineaceae bacterium]